MKQLLLFGICVVGTLSLVQTSGVQLAPSAPQTLRVICLPSRPLALSVAMELGLFAKRGVQVEARVAANSEELRNALAKGDSDVAHAAVDNAVALKEKTHLDVAVVIGGEGSTNELIAQPGVSALEALRGQIVIVDAPGTAYAIQLKKMLSLRGLEAGRDYEIKPIGGTPQRLAAMREHKEYAASILGPPTLLVAKHEGFLSLGTTRESLGRYQATGGFVLRPWAEKNRERMTAYIAAFIEAQRWIQDPGNKEPVIALLERESRLSEPLAKETYQSWIMAKDGLENDARIDREGFQNVLKLRAEVEHTWTGEVPAVETYYDDSYFEAALRMIARR